MEHCTSKHKLPDSCKKTDWLAVAIKNVQTSISDYVQVGFSREEAIIRTKKDSCAGPKVWATIE